METGLVCQPENDMRYMIDTAHDSRSMARSVKRRVRGPCRETKIKDSSLRSE